MKVGTQVDWAGVGEHAGVNLGIGAGGFTSAQREMDKVSNLEMRRLNQEIKWQERNLEKRYDQQKEELMMRKL